MVNKQLTKIGKGRSGDLIKMRNYTLVNMYYYYTEIKRLRYDDTIEALSRAFFISGRTIHNIMKEKQNNKLLSGIFKKKPSIRSIIIECSPFHIEILPHEKERYLNK